LFQKKTAALRAGFPLAAAFWHKLRGMLRRRRPYFRRVHLLPWSDALVVVTLAAFSIFMFFQWPDRHGGAVIPAGIAAIYVIWRRW
jgi:hypothetical protein